MIIYRFVFFPSVRRSVVRFDEMRKEGTRSSILLANTIGCHWRVNADKMLVVIVFFLPSKREGRFRKEID